MYNIIVINDGNNDRKGNAHVHSNQQGIRDFQDIEECIRICNGIVGSNPEHKRCVIVKKQILVKAKRYIDFEIELLDKENIDETTSNMEGKFLNKDLLELDEPKLPEGCNMQDWLPKDAFLQNITATLVAAVRKITGAGILDCKRALMATGGKESDAVRILRCKHCLGKGTVEVRKSSINPEGFIECKRCKGTRLDADVLEKLRLSINP